MAIDFPNTPAVNDTFVATNGVTYQWNGTVWLPISGTAALYVSDTPPPSPGPNQLWWNSTLGTMFLWYNDGNTTQWVPAMPNLGVAPSTPLGVLSLYQEVLLAANAANLQVSWPSGVRKIEIEYLALNVGSVADSVSFRAMLNGVINTAAAYNTQFVYGGGTPAVGGQTVNGGYWQGLAGMVITKGTLRPAVQAAQSYIEGTTWGSSASQTYAMTQGHSGTPGANMNGIQMFNSGGTLFLPGSFLRVYVVM